MSFKVREPLISEGSQVFVKVYTRVNKRNDCKSSVQSIRFCLLHYTPNQNKDYLWSKRGSKFNLDSLDYSSIRSEFSQYTVQKKALNSSKIQGIKYKVAHCTLKENFYPNSDSFEESFSHFRMLKGFSRVFSFCFLF